MTNSILQCRSDIIDEITTIKEVQVRLSTFCDGIGMELLSEKLSEMIDLLEDARQVMKDTNKRINS